VAKRRDLENALSAERQAKLNISDKLDIAAKVCFAVCALSENPAEVVGLEHGE
jgi:hypothetical protein